MSDMRNAIAWSHVQLQYNDPRSWNMWKMKLHEIQIEHHETVWVSPVPLTGKPMTRMNKCTTLMGSLTETSQTQNTGTDATGIPFKKLGCQLVFWGW